MKTRNPRNAGRNPLYDEPLTNVSTGLTSRQVRKAMRVGKDNNRQDGIRTMIDAYKEEEP